MGWDRSFEEFPKLETDRCILREIELKDALCMYEYFSKDKVTKLYDVETFTSKQQAVELVHSLQYRYREKKQIRWGIQLKKQDKLIGSCGFHCLEQEHFKAEIGYELHPDYWGRGIMTEAINKIISYGFYEMSLNRIEAFYEPANIGSQKVLEKNGFQFEGILKRRFFIKGKFVDTALTAVINEDYRGNIG